MLLTTDAIVLSLQPHSDKAHVLHAYTRAGGRINYMVYGLGRKHPSGRYTPLSLIQITANHAAPGEGGKFPTLKEATLVYSPQDGDIYKQTVSLFISEVIYHTLRYPMADEQLYDFLESSVRALDASPYFHLQFLVGFAAKLGFAIDDSPGASSRLTGGAASAEEGILLSPLTRKERQQQLRALWDYFAEHVETWQQPKSLDVLTEVFD